MVIDEIINDDDQLEVGKFFQIIFFIFIFINRKIWTINIMDNFDSFDLIDLIENKLFFQSYIKFPIISRLYMLFSFSILF